MGEGVSDIIEDRLGIGHIGSRSEDQEVPLHGIHRFDEVVDFNRDDDRQMICTVRRKPDYGNLRPLRQNMHPLYKNDAAVSGCAGLWGRLPRP